MGRILKVSATFAVGVGAGAGFCRMTRDGMVAVLTLIVWTLIPDAHHAAWDDAY